MDRELCLLITISRMGYITIVPTVSVVVYNILWTIHLTVLIYSTHNGDDAPQNRALIGKNCGACGYHLV